MRYSALALLVLPLAGPALAHPEAAGHVHGTGGVLWGAALVAVSVGLALLRLSRG
jgi:hypothetical protein